MLNIESACEPGTVIVNYQGRETAQPVRALPTKPDGLSLILRTHAVEGENQLLHVTL